MDGVLAVDKPRGPTSHDMVLRVRRLRSERRVGHAGTLDPDASGVLVLCLGRATKIARYLAAGEKEYRATLRLGAETDTGDRTGKVLGNLRPVRVGVEEIRSACRRWIGEVDQVPPMVSAVKQAGVRLYELARAGVEVDRAPRRVRIDEINVVDASLPFVTLRIRCGTGTYVRSLAKDLGVALGCGAHVFTLRRTRVGVIGLDRCMRWNGAGTVGNGLDLSMDEALDFLPAVTMDSEETRLIRTGQGIRRDSAESAQQGWVRLRDGDGGLVAVGSLVRQGRSVMIRPSRVLWPQG